MSLLSGRWLASKRRIDAILVLVIVKAIIQKSDTVLVRVVIMIKVMFDAVNLGLHLGNPGAV